MKRTASTAGRLLLAGMILALSPVQVLAETTDAFQFFEEEARVVTASKRPEKISEAPATMMVITKKDIRMRGYMNLRDVFKDLPGMEAIDSYYSEFGTEVPVRGVIGNNKIVVLLNGMRVNPPGGEPMMFRGDFSVRDADRVEVMYGPGSTLYGQDAISLVVNVITESPSENKVEMAADSGYPVKKEGWISIQKPTSWGGVLVHFQALNSDLPDLSREYPDEWARFQAVSASKGSGSIQSRWDNGYNAVLRMEGEESSLQIFERWSSQSSSEGQLPTFTYQPQAKWTDSSIVIEGRNKLELSDRVALESAMTFNRYEVQPESLYEFQSTATQWASNPKYGIGTSGTLEEKINVDITKNVLLTGGISAAHHNVIPKATIPGGVDRSQDIISQAGNLTYYTRAGDATSAVSVPGAYDLTYQDFGAFIEGSWRVIEPLKIILGARVDKDTRFNKVPFSPRVAAIYDLASNWVAKYIHTEAYVSPSPYFGYNVFANSTIVNIANKNLAPEQASSDELNMEYRLGRWTNGASLYFNRQTKLTVIGNAQLPQNILNPTVYLDAAGTQARALTQTANVGNSTSKGIDLYSRYGWGQNDLWASYSNVDFETDNNRVKTGLPGISRQQGRLGITCAILKNLFVTPSLVIRSTPEFVKNMGTLQNDLHNPYQINLSVVYAPVKDIDLFGTVLNLTNNHYALSALALNAAPQNTLQVTTGIRWAFRLGGRE